jgi:hypothetical protein
LELKPNRNNFLYCSSMKKNFFLRIQIVHGVTFEFEYLGEFAFIFKNFLYYETGSQIGSIDGKKMRSKISCKCTFNLLRTVFEGAWSWTGTDFIK